MIDYSAFARAKAFQELKEEELNWFEDLEDDNFEFDSKIQRPESMVIPIGGVWRPDDEPVEQFFLDQPPTNSNLAPNSNLTGNSNLAGNSISNTTTSVHQSLHQSSTITATETTTIDSSTYCVLLSALLYTLCV